MDVVCNASKAQCREISFFAFIQKKTSTKRQNKALRGQIFFVESRTNVFLEVTRCQASANPVASTSKEEGSSEDVPRFSVAATKQLTKATRALRSYGWFGFWCQLALGLTSGVVLIFSIAFTAQV